jgi:hypothetical protein
MKTLVATELHNAGFETKITPNGINATLTNRNPSKMELTTALDKIFPEIDFNLTSTNNGVFIRL